MPFLVDTWDFDGEIDAIAISPDSTRVGASCNKEITIWDIGTNKRVLGPLVGHKSGAMSLCFSPDGRIIVSSSVDKTMRIWDTETGKAVIEPVVGHNGSVYSVVFSPDRCLIISGSRDETIRQWDAHTGKPVADPIHTNDIVWSIALSSDGRRVFSAGGKTIKAYDLATGTMLLEGVGHSETIDSIALSPDGLRIASASADHTVRIWNAETGGAIGEPLKGHGYHVTYVVFSPDNKYIASASRDGTVRIWDAETGAAHGDPLTGHDWHVMVVAFTPDGSYLVSGARDDGIKIWDVRDLGIRAQIVEPDIRIDARAQNSTTEDEIASTTTPQQIVAHLGARGCPNMTGQLDLTTCSEHPVSSGGFGDIYRCKLRSGIEVAIKTFRLHVGPGEQSQKHLKYAARELYTWSKCQHPNVQRLLGLVIFRGQIGMLASWETNGSMPQYLERHANADRCIMSTQIAEGLSYLHGSGVIHGDLKGANVLVSDRGVPQLADFGNAALQEYTLQFTKTSTKDALSSRWAAPELFEGGSISFAADVYALGMTILEAITGEIPWAEQSERSVIFAMTIKKVCPKRPEANIPTYSEHGDTLWSLLKWCWEIESERRPTVVQVKEIIKGVTQNGLKSVDVEMADADI